MLLVKLVINGEERSFDEPLTLSGLIERMGIKADRVAVELNRTIIRRDDWPATELHDGDHLEVVHFVGGGLGGLEQIHKKCSRWKRGPLGP